MLHSVRRLTLVVAILALSCASSAYAAKPVTILVKFKQPASASAKIAALGDDLVGQTATRASIVRLGAGRSATARISTYAGRADVLYAEPNRQVHALGLAPPSDPKFSSQWAFTRTAVLDG